LSTASARRGGLVRSRTAAHSNRLDATPELGALPSLLSVVVYGAAAAVAAYPLAVPSAVVAAASGAMIGALLGPRLARSRLRVPAQLGAVALVLVAGAALRALVTSSPAVASWIGPAGALVFGDALLFGVGALGLVTCLRLGGTRRRLFVGLEVVAVGAAFAALLLSHRHGAINRPFELADPIITAGLDPTMLFLAFGAATAVVIALLMMRERSPLRGALHLGSALLLLLLLLAVAERVGLPTPPVGGLGSELRGDGKSGQQSGRGNGRGGSSNDDWEFKDQAQSAGQAPVAVVVFHDEYSAPNGVYYFRQSALSQFNGHKLVRATRGDVDDDLPDGFPTAAAGVDAPPPPLGRQPLETTVALLADHPRPFGLEAIVELAPDENPDPARFRRTYRVTSSALTADTMAMLGSASGDPRWTPEVWAHYTRVPDDARYGELARRIVDESLPEALRDDPMAEMVAITGWLGREGTYSLRSRHADADDPTAHFLFGDKVGYCVHFAHAAAYLMRSIGLPARVATGYAVEEAARQGGSSLMIQGSRAHMWPEIYLADYGWVVADVYPQQSLDPSPQAPDPELQRLLGEMARGQHHDNPVARVAREQILTTIRHTAWRTGLWAAAFLGLVIALGFAVKLWRRLRPRFAGPEAWPRVAYRAELDRLAEVALRRAPGESREAFARRVAPVAPSFGALTAVHVGAAFGSREAIAEAARRRGTIAVGRELRARFPAWRRALGLLFPFSWLFSR
jgi:transglutaminase-like putative cysteine protease